MRFSRFVCSVTIAVAGLAMTGQSYASGGHGGGQGCFSGRHNGHDGGGHHRHHGGGRHGNHGWVSRSFYGYGYGYGYPYYSYPYYYDYGAYPTVYRGYVANDYYALAVWVQKALARRGYYHGPIDGVVGQGTRRAIRGYRADYGLPVSSRIDDELLKALG
jgi:Putative peptidoglycan binding domain